MKLSVRTTIKRGNLGPVWDKPVPDRWLCFCLNFLSFCWWSLVAFGEFAFQKIVTNQQFGLELCAVRQDTFGPHQDYEQVNFYKTSLVISLVGHSETGKMQSTYNWLKIGTFQTKFDKIYFLYQHSQPLYDGMQEEIENLEFVPGLNFEFIHSLKNNDTKYLLIFDNSCEEICNSNAFVDIATAGRHQGLSTTYIKHNLFHQSKLGKDVELQNTHIVLFKSPRDVMQGATLSTQLGLGRELVDWYRDSTSVLFGHFLIDLSPRTDDRLRYCTNTRSIPSKLYNSDRLKQSKVLDDEHTKSLYSPSAPIIFPQKQKSFPSVLLKRVYPVSLRKHNKSAQRKTAKHKKTTRGKISQRVSTIVKRTTWKKRRDILVSERGLQIIKVITPPVINHLSWSGPVCPRSCFWVQEKFDYPVSYKAWTSKVSTFTKSHLPNWFT